MLPAHHIVIRSVAQAPRRCWRLQPKLPSPEATGSIRTGWWPRPPLGMAKAPKTLGLCSSPEHQPCGVEPWCGAADCHRATLLPWPPRPTFGFKSSPICHFSLGELCKEP